MRQRRPLAVLLSRPLRDNHFPTNDLDPLNTIVLQPAIHKKLQRDRFFYIATTKLFFKQALHGRIPQWFERLLQLREVVSRNPPIANATAPVPPL